VAGMQQGRAMRMSISSRSRALSVALLSVARQAVAQTPPTGGAPPADLTQVVASPKGPGDAPKPNELSVNSTDAARPFQGWCRRVIAACAA